jgi:hypothetical protein
LSDERFDLLAVDAFTWTAHLATTVEICLRHAEMGRRVGFVFLDVDNIDELPPRVVPETPMWRWYERLLRRSRRTHVATIERILRDNGVTVIPSPRPASPNQRVSCSSLGIDSIESLRDFRIDGAALGFGVLSSVIRHQADASPDFGESRTLIDHLLNTSLTTFDLARQVIERYQPGSVLVYNGRLTCSKAISEAARLAGADVLYHEIGATHERFYLSERPLHSAVNLRTMMNENWAVAGPEREAIAESFFTRGRGGAPLIFTEFYRGQEPGHSIPPRGLRRIVYFVSSDDEHAAVQDGLEHPLFDSQRSAATWLADWVRNQPGVELLIRVHPRMRTSSHREQAWWDSLSGGSVTTLRADSPVDSYALAAGADVVVCYRSTMGAEATYLGKAAIAVGDGVYRGLDCVHEPRTIAEFERMLGDPDLPPKPRENCLPFGYERMTRGTTYRFYRPESVEAGTLFDQHIGPAKLNVIDRAGLKLLETIGRRSQPYTGPGERALR